jgi:hypothetical protein
MREFVRCCILTNCPMAGSFASARVAQGACSGTWRTGELVERHAHLAPDHLAVAASRLDPPLVGYDPAT